MHSQATPLHEIDSFCSDCFASTQTDNLKCVFGFDANQPWDNVIMVWLFFVRRWENICWFHYWFFFRDKQRKIAVNHRSIQAIKIIIHAIDSLFFLCVLTTPTQFRFSLIFLAFFCLTHFEVNSTVDMLFLANASYTGGCVYQSLVLHKTERHWPTKKKWPKTNIFFPPFANERFGWHHIIFTKAIALLFHAQ